MGGRGGRHGGGGVPGRVRAVCEGLCAAHVAADAGGRAGDVCGAGVECGGCGVDYHGGGGEGGFAGYGDGADVRGYVLGCRTGFSFGEGDGMMI